MDQSQGELQPFLLECFEAADDGAEYVIERNRPPVLKTGGGWSHANLRTRCAKSFAEPDWSSGHVCGITFEPVGRLSWRISFRHMWCVPGSATRNPLPVSITCR